MHSCFNLVLWAAPNDEFPFNSFSNSELALVRKTPLINISRSNRASITPLGSDPAICPIYVVRVTVFKSKCLVVYPVVIQFLACVSVYCFHLFLFALDYHCYICYFVNSVEDDTTRTRSEIVNELNENKVQFARIMDKNLNFVLCQFQNRNSKTGLFVNITQTFQTDIEQNFGP